MSIDPSRLIVAADFKPDANGIPGVIEKVLALARILEGTGVTIKVNSVLRAVGYGLIGKLHDYDLKVFADLKLNDISATLETDAELLAMYRPDFLTVMCSTGNAAARAVKQTLPTTQVLGVTVLTSLKEEECLDIYGHGINTSVMSLATLAKKAGLDGVVSSPKELELLVPAFAGKLSFNTPGIRPEWSVVKSEDQNLDRVMTPRLAMEMGATTCIIGRPITQAASPLEAVQRTLEEMG